MKIGKDYLQGMLGRFHIMNKSGLKLNNENEKRFFGTPK